MLNLNCPNCGSPHRIDSAFRGGVARCQACGALIHVPTKDGKPIEAQTGRKKRPKTPDSPQKAGKRPKAAAVATRVAPRRFSGKVVTITLVVSVLVLAAIAIWWISSTALRTRGG